MWDCTRRWAGLSLFHWSDQWLDLQMKQRLVAFCDQLNQMCVLNQTSYYFSWLNGDWTSPIQKQTNTNCSVLSEAARIQCRLSEKQEPVYNNAETKKPDIISDRWKHFQLFNKICKCSCATIDRWASMTEWEGCGYSSLMPRSSKHLTSIQLKCLKDEMFKPSSNNTITSDIM